MRTGSDALLQSIDLAVAAEELGADGAYFRVHHFAASFLVAGQWDPTLVAPMAKNRLWILVSQDDNKAFPGENAITEALEAEGAKISRAAWDGRWSADQFRFAFDDLDAEESPINYVTFAQGTVIPAGESTAGASGHRNTWRVAYTIEPIREWIFRQHK